MKHHIVIAGAGGIGRAVGLLLANYPGIQGTICIGDRHLESARSAANWIEEGKSHPIEIIPFELPPEGAGFTGAAHRGGVVLDCLPGSEAPRIARFALENGMHYANLTEYVAETETIKRMAQDAETGFVLQTGLAPGFINVLACGLYDRFTARFGQKQVDQVTMRVGALTSHTREPHYYGFTWSPIGVATEYMKPSLVIRNGEQTWLDALSEREFMVIDGQKYEADLTSGGAADLPDAFEGIARNLDYKTLRYPGHYAWVDNLKTTVSNASDPIQALEDRMLTNIPSVDEDLIVIYASVTGEDQQGVLRRIEKSFNIGPLEVGGKRLRAIQSTTAGPLAECARILLTGQWSGVILQSQIDPETFMTGPFVSKIYVTEKRAKGLPVVV